MNSISLDSFLYLLGGLLNAVSLLMRNMLPLRVVFLTSLILYIVYGLILRSPSVIVTSIIFSLINLFEIIRILLARRKKQLPSEFSEAYSRYSSLLDVESFLLLIKSCEIVEYPLDSVIVKEEKKIDFLALILSGEADVFQENEWLCHLQPGDFIGEFSHLTGLLTCATVTATKDCRAAVWKIKDSFTDENLLKMVNFNVSKKLIKSNTPSLREAFSSSKHFHAICRTGKKEIIPIGEFIRKGVQLSRLYFIVSGKAAVKAKGETVAILQHGDFIGEYSTLTGKSTTADIYCLEEMEVLAWDKRDIEENRELYDLIHTNIAKKLSDTAESLLINKSLENLPFVQKARKKRFRNERIIESGALIEEVILLVEGNGELYQGDEKVASLKKGDLYGERAIFHKCDSPFSLVAKGDVEIALWSIEEAKNENELLRIVHQIYSNHIPTR